MRKAGRRTFVKSFLAGLCGLALFGSSLCLAQEKSLDASLIKLEQQLCAAFAAQDTATVNRLLAADSMTAESGKTFTHKAGIEFHTADVVIKSYDLSEFKVVPITKDVAVVYMKAVTDATRAGKKLPPVNYVSTVWAKRGGSWKAVYSTSYTPQE
jgi:hypothetical protein